jgi:hypothetical protein
MTRKGAAIILFALLYASPGISQPLGTGLNGSPDVPTQSYWRRAESDSRRFDACPRHRRRTRGKRGGEHRTNSTPRDYRSAGNWDSDPTHAAESWQRTVPAGLLSSIPFSGDCAEHASDGHRYSRQSDDDRASDARLCKKLILIRRRCHAIFLI